MPSSDGAALFLLIRHAMTDAVGETLVGRAPGVGLNAAGRRQAERLADALDGVGIGAVYASPLERARQTAAPLAARRRLAVEVAEPLQEIGVGAWQGRRFRDLDPDPEWQRFNRFRSSTAAPGGELMLEVQARLARELESLRRRHAGEIVALISHGDVIRAGLAHYLGMPLDLMLRLEVLPASVSMLALGPHGAKVLGLNLGLDWELLFAVGAPLAGGE